MRKPIVGVVAGLILLSVAGLWYRSRSGGAVQLTAVAQAEDRISEPIQPIPLHVDLDARKVALGDKVFHDPQLSRDNTISCASCHNLETGGVDRLPTSVGIHHAVGPINAPTVFNSGFNFKQFWDGRAATLEEQIDGPVHADKEMASDWPSAIQKLSRDAGYVTAFKTIYGTGINEHDIKDAIATFERSLYTPNARFDRYLRGDAKAISRDEREGYQLFKEYGCATCHQGVNVGGNMFQKLGVMADYFADRGNVSESDQGRFNATHDERDRQAFKVPSLRNIELTAPYFHDGSAETVEEAVSVMAKYQLGRRLTDDQKALIVQFLKSLTGEYKGKTL